MEQFLLDHHGVVYSSVFFGTIAVVALWESLAPRRALRASMTTRWTGNFGCLLFGGLLLWSVYAGWGIGASVMAAQYQWGLLHLMDLPYWAEFAIALALLDFGHYAIHWCLHRFEPLWRIHRLHHTDQDFDFTTGWRFHPLEAVLEHGANLLVVLLVGPPVMAVMLFALSYALTTCWVHGNIRMPGNCDSILRRVLVTPDMHRTHHSQIERETNSNYGGLFSLWDRLFGTYVDRPSEGHEGMRIGIREFSDPKHVRFDWMMRNPLLRANTDHRS